MSRVVIPGYRLIKKLGSGGMAHVFLAEQSSLTRQVALKIMTTRSDPEKVERFFQEARLVARLHHPNIVAVHDIGEVDGLIFIAMDYMPGGNLTELLKQQPSLPIERTLQIIQDIALALQHAHENSIVHRDIKPDNVLFSLDQSRAVLTDFGIARDQLANTELTQVGTTLGTPKYMSPEQARGKPLDGRSDLYSLGVLLYQMLTGSLPYHAPDALTLALAHIQKPPPALPTNLAWLQPLIDKSMAKQPDERFVDGQAMIAFIQSLPRQQEQPYSLKPEQNVPVLPQPHQDCLFEEKVLGTWYARQYQLHINLFADDIESFQRHLAKIQEYLYSWRPHKNRRKNLYIHITAHPWIHGRVQELLHASRQENTALGTFMQKHEVFLQLMDDRGVLVEHSWQPLSTKMTPG